MGKIIRLILEAMGFTYAASLGKAIEKIFQAWMLRSVLSSGGVRYLFLKNEGERVDEKSVLWACRRQMP